MKFNLLFRDANIDPKDVSIILNTVKIQPLRKLLPRMVADHPDLFLAYQSVHNDRASATIRNREFVAPFVPIDDRRLVFSGLFRVVSQTLKTTREIYADPRFARLDEEFGATDVAPLKSISDREHQWSFELKPMVQLSELIGRLTIGSSGHRAYVRLAQNLDAEVLAISERSLLTAPVPNWRDLCIGKAELVNLPGEWKLVIGQWRGIYLIVDEGDGARYVGSAYGAENLWGRWQAHVARDAGVTKELVKRDPKNFRFSILERVGPDMTADEVIAVENSWKQRLHTREFGLNNN